MRRHVKRRAEKSEDATAGGPPGAVARLFLRGLNALLRFAGLEARPKEALRELDHARRYEHYWYNASKKIEIRKVAGFGKAAHRVLEEGRTYLHFDRLYTLWQAAGALESDEPAVAEVGAYKGGSAKLIAEALRFHGRVNRFYVCDTFEGHTVVDPALDGHHEVGHQFGKTSAEKVAAYLGAYENVRVLKGDIQETSATLAAERAFGFLHIDVDVYPITKFCLEFFGPRMVRGGVMIVDDYGLVTCEGAKVAVDEFVRANRHFRTLHMLTAQAVLVRVG